MRARLSPEEQVIALLKKKDARLKFKHLMAKTHLTKDELNVVLSNLVKQYPNLTFNKYDRTFMLSSCPTWYTDSTDLSQVMPLEGVFGSISDTHLCSIAERLDNMETAYDTFASAGVKVVFHSGD